MEVNYGIISLPNSYINAIHKKADKKIPFYNETGLQYHRKEHVTTR